MAGTTSALNDSGVGVGAVRINTTLSGEMRYLYTAGTARLSSSDTVFQAARHPFDPSVLSSADSLVEWPSGTHTSAARTLVATHVYPRNSDLQGSGVTRIYLAGFVPDPNDESKTHYDLWVLAYNEKLHLLWTNRLTDADHASYPVSLWANDGGVLVGSTTTYSGRDCYLVRYLETSDGAATETGVCDTGVSGGSAVLTAVQITSDEPFSAIACGTATGSDGYSKMTPVTFDPASGGVLTPTKQLVYGDSDGKTYKCNAMAYGGAAYNPANGVLTMTGSIKTGSYDDYLTISLTPSGSPWTLNWTDQYDGTAGLIDVATAIANLGASEPDDGIEYTWVTGYSQNGSGSDTLTILYVWDGSALSRRWVARRSEPSGAPAATLATGLALANDAIDTTASTIIYVLAAVQKPDSGSVLRWNYQYLSYDANDPGSGVNKLTRWENTTSHVLPEHCYYGTALTGGGALGDSYPGGFAVHNFPDPSTGTPYWYMLRNGTSYQSSSTLNDTVTTLELDTASH